MSERAQKFDSFDRPKKAAAVPEAGLDRVLEALMRCRSYLPTAIVTKLSELWDPDTALAFAVLLAVWGGLQFTAIGWVADLLAAVYGFASIAGDFVDAAKAGYHASQAETDEDLDTAAQEMARVISGSAVDAIAALIGGFLFARFRKLVRFARSRLLPRRFPTKGGASEPLTLKSRLISAADKLPFNSSGRGPGVALVRGAVALSHAKKEVENEAKDLLFWGAVVVGGGAAVYGLISLARSGGSS